MVQSFREFDEQRNFEDYSRQYKMVEACQDEKMKEFMNFLNQLEDSKIYYALSKIRPDSVLVTVAVPGQRWEIEFMDDGSVEIEKFLSDGKILDERELKTLFSEFSD